MPRISKAMDSHERVMAKDALDDIARKRAQATASNSKYTDPSGLHAGFKRDQWNASDSLPTERGQSAFLTKANLDTPQEMPDDLLKFLNDAGPMEKRVDKEFTSPKVYESLLVEEEQRRQQQQQDRQRRRRVMPIVGDGELDADADRMDGTTVSRTTNFSTAVRDENEAQVRLGDKELFQLLTDLQAEQITSDAFVRNKFSGEESVTEEQRQDNINLIESMKKYTAIPALMQDTDKSLVGAWPDEIEELKMVGVRMTAGNAVLSFEHELAMSKGLHLSNTLERKEKASTSTAAFLSHAKSLEEEKKEKEPMSTAEFLRQAKSSS